jgi:hypothetical protein
MTSTAWGMSPLLDAPDRAAQRVASHLPRPHTPLTQAAPAEPAKPVADADGRFTDASGAASMSSRGLSRSGVSTLPWRASPLHRTSAASGVGAPPNATASAVATPRPAEMSAELRLPAHPTPSVEVKRPTPTRHVAAMGGSNRSATRGPAIALDVDAGAYFVGVPPPAMRRIALAASRVPTPRGPGIPAPPAPVHPGRQHAPAVAGSTWQGGGGVASGSGSGLEGATLVAAHPRAAVPRLQELIRAAAAAADAPAGRRTTRVVLRDHASTARTRAVVASGGAGVAADVNNSKRRR